MPGRRFYSIHLASSRSHLPSKRIDSRFPFVSIPSLGRSTSMHSLSLSKPLLSIQTKPRRTFRIPTHGTDRKDGRIERGTPKGWMEGSDGIASFGTCRMGKPTRGGWEGDWTFERIPRGGIPGFSTERLARTDSSSIRTVVFDADGCTIPFDSSRFNRKEGDGSYVCVGRDADLDSHRSSFDRRFDFPFAKRKASSVRPRRSSDRAPRATYAFDSGGRSPDGPS